MKSCGLSIFLCLIFFKNIKKFVENPRSRHHHHHHHQPEQHQQHRQRHSNKPKILIFTNEFEPTVIRWFQNSTIFVSSYSIHHMILVYSYHPQGNWNLLSSHRLILCQTRWHLVIIAAQSQFDFSS